MADTKITALTALTAADPANDVIPIVDVSDTSMAASGTTKKISVNNILGASGTATLASATITGDLTVDTSTLKVDSTNNRVGVGTASPAYPLSVAGRISYASAIGEGPDTTVSSSGTSLLFGNSATWSENQFYANGNLQYRIQSAGIFTWTDGAGGTRMTLNATGLGVGGVPISGFRLNVNNGDFRVSDVQNEDGVEIGWSAGGSNGFVQAYNRTTSAFKDLVLNAAVTINAAGNCGIGVTPSAWLSSLSALQVKGINGIYGAGSSEFGSVQNCFYNASSQWIYGTTAAAGKYAISSGVHQWYNAPSGTAGSGITFTQAMTLDASGNLLVGTTTNAGVRLDVQTTTGNCIGRVKSNAAASTASFIIDYVETLGCTYIKKAGSDVWIYGVQNDTSATPAFKINTASNVGVQLVSGATSWTTLSDETMKDIIEPISNAVAKVGSLRSVIGKFKTDDSSKRRSFLIAQDVQSVLPEAVDVIGENNELGLRYTEVIPLLVAAIKELTARVQTLETR